MFQNYDSLIHTSVRYLTQAYWIRHCDTILRRVMPWSYRAAVSFKQSMAKVIYVKGNLLLSSHYEERRMIQMKHFMLFRDIN